MNIKNYVQHLLTTCIWNDWGKSSTVRSQ